MTDAQPKGFMPREGKKEKEKVSSNDTVRQTILTVEKRFQKIDKEQ